MKFKDENNQVHDPEMDETKGLALLKKVHPDMTFTPITDEEAIILNAPIPLTEQEKDVQALAAASSPALESAIEEFSAILDAAGIAVPADVKANITARIKGKLS